MSVKTGVYILGCTYSMYTPLCKNLSQSHKRFRRSHTKRGIRVARQRVRGVHPYTLYTPAYTPSTRWHG
jgi:hypothetical protein